MKTFGVLVIFAMLSGCVAALPVASIVGTRMVMGDGSDAILRQMEPEMVEALSIGQRRHPDVFGSLTVEDPKFECLFLKEYQTYLAYSKTGNLTRAANIAVDRAADRSRAGECGLVERNMRTLIPPGFAG